MHPITLSFTVTDGTSYKVSVDASDIREIRDRRDATQPGTPIVGSTIHFKSTETALVVNEPRETVVSMIVPPGPKNGSAKKSTKDEKK